MVSVYISPSFTAAQFFKEGYVESWTVQRPDYLTIARSIEWDYSHAAEAKARQRISFEDWFWGLTAPQSASHSPDGQPDIRDRRHSGRIR
jgi:hypothetical protein